MGYRYEYEEVEGDIFDKAVDAIGESIGDIFIPEPSPTVYRCTIYDEDTDEELAEGLGHSEGEARYAAERNL